MDMSSKIQSQMDQAQSAFDLKGLDNLRRGAQQGDRQALEKTAEQFEAIFIHMMLKSMRDADDVLADEDSPFNSKEVKFYRGMHDQQMATEMAKTGSMGLKELIVQQLDPEGSGVTPASLIRRGGNLSNLDWGSAVSKSNIDLANSNQMAGAVKKAAFESADEFVNSLMPAAKKVAGELGLDPKALVAQAAVETGWGQHMIHAGTGENTHNLFGIKADRDWQGNKQVVETLEYEQGIPQKQKAAFRAYDNFDSAMQDYVQFIKESPRYRDAVEQSANPESYFKQLQLAGYATDPAYADKVLSVLNSDKLAAANNKI